MGRPPKLFPHNDVEELRQGRTQLRRALKEKETGQVQVPLWAVEGLVQGLVRELEIENAELATSSLLEWATGLVVIVNAIPSKSTLDVEIYSSKILANEVPFIIEKVRLEFDHPTEILRQQANWLSQNAFGDYPFKARNDVTRMSWIDKNLSLVLQGLTAYIYSIEEDLGSRCCNSCPRKNSPPQGKERTAFSCIKTPAKLRNAVLGYHHGLSLETVKRSLSGRPSRSKRQV